MPRRRGARARHRRPVKGQIARLASRDGAGLVVGVDPTLAQIAVAQRAGRRSRIRPRRRRCAAVPPTTRSTRSSCASCSSTSPSHEPAIAEIARVLEPGGRFVFFLNHPLLQAPNSGWIDRLTSSTSSTGGSVRTSSRTCTMEELAPGVVLPFVHRPLSQYVNAMAAQRPAHRADGRADAARRLPCHGRRSTATRRRSRACCDGRPQDRVIGVAGRVQVIASIRSSATSCPLGGVGVDDDLVHDRARDEVLEHPREVRARRCGTSSSTGRSSGSSETIVLSGCSRARRCTMWISVPIAEHATRARRSRTQSWMRSVDPTRSAISTTSCAHSGAR